LTIKDCLARERAVPRADAPRRVVSKTPADAPGARYGLQDGARALRALSADAAGELDVLGEDGDALGVDGAQVGVLEQADEVGLGGLLQGARMAEDWTRRSDFKSWAISRTRRWNGRKLAELSRLLVAADLAKADGARPVAMRFFTLPVAGADFQAALVARALRGALLQVDWRVVCLVRAISRRNTGKGFPKVYEGC
jgi:hypothetical protein